MKKLLHIIIEFFISFIGSEIILIGLVVLNSAIQNQNEPPLLLLGSIASIPLSLAIASFICFFPLSRLYKSRFFGYLTMIILSWLFLAGLAFLIKMVFPQISAQETIAVSSSFPSELPGYTSCLSWFLEVGALSWPLMLMHTFPVAMMLASFWGVTRVTKKRPLFGALLAPLACFGFFFLLSIFQSIPANAVFVYLGIPIPRLLSASIYTALCAPAFFLFDVLFSAPPKGDSPEGSHG